ncbi:MAG TPA: ABC transporter substrate-binding protein [Acidimicrobiales bacterium]|jgi:branched-chain amino acid transport system substrate-binding protein|nr:ABC transporter substrate-binding protein [Acidimicrobiales bacterium]
MRARRSISLLAAATLVVGASACGDDDSSDDTAADRGGNGELQLDDPVKIAFLWEVSGESANAVDFYQNSAELAVDAINDAGGIGGQPVETVRITAPPLDLQKSQAAYLEALDEDPDVIVGFPSSGQVDAAQSNIERGGVPFLSVASQNLRFGDDGISQWMWALLPSVDSVVGTTVEYMTEEEGYEDIGLMATSETFGTAAGDAAKAALDDKDLEPVAERTYEPDATDLTEAVLAMGDAEAVMDWGFPNPMAVQLKQFRQNGLDIPTFMHSAAQVIVENDLATGDEIAQLHASVPCNPTGTDRPSLQAFTQTYQDEFGVSPSSSGTAAHDAVYIVKAAVEAAGGTDPAALNEALGSITVEDDALVCNSEYHADGAHYLAHQVSVIQFAGDGSSTTKKTYTVPDADAG